MDYSVMGFMKYVRKKTFNRDIFSYARFKYKEVFKEVFKEYTTRARDLIFRY